MYKGRALKWQNIFINLIILLVNHRGQPVLLDYETEWVFRRNDSNGKSEHDYNITIANKDFSNTNNGYHLIKIGDTGTMTYEIGFNSKTINVEVTYISPIKKGKDINITFTEI